MLDQGFMRRITNKLEVIVIGMDAAVPHVNKHYKQL